MSPLLNYEFPKSENSEELLDDLTEKFNELREFCEGILEKSREASLVSTNLQQAYLWAVESVRNTQFADVGEGS